MVELHYRNQHTGAIHRAIFSSIEDARAQAAVDSGVEPDEEAGTPGHWPEQQPFLIAKHDPAGGFDPASYDPANVELLEVVNQDILERVTSTR